MKRRWFAAIGGVFLLPVVVLLVRSDPPDRLDLPLVLLAVASALLVLGGLDPVPDAVPWHRFVGLGVVLFGVALLAMWAGPAVDGSGSNTDVLMALTGVAAGLVFGFIGVDWFLGGRHYDLSRVEPGPILGSGTGGERE